MSPQSCSRPSVWPRGRLARAYHPGGGARLRVEDRDGQLVGCRSLHRVGTSLAGARRRPRVATGAEKERSGNFGARRVVSAFVNEPERITSPYAPARDELRPRLHRQHRAARQERADRPGLARGRAPSRPSLVIAHSPCIAHGYDLVHAPTEQKRAVDSGMWPLYRFAPHRTGSGEPALVLDSRAPHLDVATYMANEPRFRIVELRSPERYQELVGAARGGAPALGAVRTARQGPAAPVRRLTAAGSAQVELRERARG